MQQMTHAERILAAIQHQPTDRIPLDYWGVPEITQKVMKAIGAKDDLEMAEILDIDRIMQVEPILKPGRQSTWDIPMKLVSVHNGLGWYEEPVRHPLADFETIDEVEAGYVWPTTEMFDYSTIAQQCRRYREAGFAVEGGYISLSCFYEMLRGTENMLLDLAADEELSRHILFRLNEFAAAHTKKILEAGEGMIQLSQVTDDFGAQNGLLLSPEMIESYFGNYYRQNIAMVKSYQAHVFHHDDGAIQALIPWLVEQGAEVLNPLQWHLPGWDLAKLKKDFGGELCFHGGIDNQFVLPFGDVEAVRQEVRDCMDHLYVDKTGYILAPCHNLQVITPLENIFEMYRFAKEYSKEFH